MDRKGVQTAVILFSLWAAAALLAVGIAGNAFSGDAGWSWRTGQWILSHGVPHTGIWSWWVPHARWVDTEWLWEVLLAVVQAKTGFYGVEWLDAVIWGGLGVLLWVGWRQWAGLPRWMAAVGLAWGAVSFLPYMETRPQIVSYAALAGTLLIIRATAPTQRLWWLVPVTWVWAQCHGSFPLVWVALGMTALGYWGSTWRHPTADAQRVLAVLAGTILVTLINPYGWHLWTYVAHMMDDPWFTANINEWQSPQFYQVYWILVGILPLGLFLWRGGRWWAALPKSLRLGAVLVFLEFLMHVRYFPYVWITAWAALWWAPPVEDPARSDRGPTHPAWGAAWLVVAVLGVAMADVSGGQFRTHNNPTIALRWVTTHPHPRLINGPNIGGDLLAAGVRPFIDGRADLYTALPMTWRNPENLAQAILYMGPSFSRAWHLVHPETVFDTRVDPVNVWLAAHGWHRDAAGKIWEVWSAPRQRSRAKRARTASGKSTHNAAHISRSDR